MQCIKPCVCTYSTGNSSDNSTVVSSGKQLILHSAYVVVVVQCLPSSDTALGVHVH
jgi:hypothetical protein